MNEFQLQRSATPRARRDLKRKRKKQQRYTDAHKGGQKESENKSKLENRVTVRLAGLRAEAAAATRSQSESSLVLHQLTHAFVLGDG